MSSPKYKQFDSACGLHVNLVANDDALYVPTFGEDPKNQKYGQSVARDNEVLGTIRRNTQKTVIPVPVPYDVCKMGGNVRCLSWQVNGDVADELVWIAQNYRSC